MGQRGNEILRLRSLLGAALVLLASLAPPSHAVASAETFKDPVLESWSGPSVKLVMGKTPVEPRTGLRLPSGLQVRTNEGTLTLAYPDGSRILVGPRTEFTLEDPERGTLCARLAKGEIRGLITKLPGGALAKRPRYMIRTKAAVMGVRGTDFLMQTTPDGERAVVRTFEGAVEVADSPQALFSGKTVVVSQDQFVRATPSEISAPLSFDGETFLASPSTWSAAPAAALGISPSQREATPPAEPAPDRKTPEGNAREKPAADSPPPPSPKESEPPPSEPPASAEPPGRRHRLLRFRVGAQYIEQQSGSKGYGPQASFDPTLTLLGLHVGVHLGAFPLRDRATNQTFIVKEGAVTAGLQLGPLDLEAGVGGQDWEGWLEGSPMGLVHITWVPDSHSLIRGFYVGAAAFGHKYNPAVQLRAGLQLHL